MNGETQGRTRAPRKARKPQAPTSAGDFKPLLTLEAVAALMDTTPGQVANARSRGQMPEGIGIIVPGFGLRFKAGKLKAWLMKLADEAVTS